VVGYYVGCKKQRAISAGLGLFGGSGGHRKEKAQAYKAKPELAVLFGGSKKRNYCFVALFF